MEPLNQTPKKYGSRAMVVAIIGAFILILAGHKPVGKGLILGTIFSVINFVLIAQTLPLRLSQTRRKTFALSLGSIFFRYTLLAVPLIIAVKFEQFDLPAAIFGIFMIQLVILADYLRNLLAPHEKL
jgi:asparagine N-glycosylation enzyme membrane subunit Stt3